MISNVSRAQVSLKLDKGRHTYVHTIAAVWLTDINIKFPVSRLYLGVPHERTYCQWLGGNEVRAVYKRANLKLRLFLVKYCFNNFNNWQETFKESIQSNNNLGHGMPKHYKLTWVLLPVFVEPDTITSLLFTSVPKSSLLAFQTARVFLSFNSL